MTRDEIQDTVNRIERREAARRLADRMEAGRRQVQRVMVEIKESALHVPMVPGTIAQCDFKPGLIVDSVTFTDVWGDAR